MKTLTLITLGLLAAGINTQAQFNSGSTGARGPLVVATNLIVDLPDDGILHFSTVTVQPGAVLRFRKNLKNTPVYLLATGDVTIQGVIHVDGGDATLSAPFEPGRGGPGGFDGGWPGLGGIAAGDGYGPGGGKAGTDAVGGCFGAASTAGCGAYATSPSPHYGSLNKGQLYGSPLLVPMVGGSGGGGVGRSGQGVGGGGGGGGIVIASNTRIEVSGSVSANGGRGMIFRSGCDDVNGTDPNPGSGGAIRLVAPAVAGGGGLYCSGRTYGAAQGSHGRVRIDTIDPRNLNLGVIGLVTYGKYMVVFPTTLPSLDIIEAAGASIKPGAGPVTVQLPNNAPTAQVVKLQASNFFGYVTNYVVVTPQSGPSATYVTVIDNASANPATGNVTVTLPVSTPVSIAAWNKVP